MTFCPLRWTYLQVDLQQGRVRACCKTPYQQITADDLAEYGVDAVFDGPYVRGRRAEMLSGGRHDDCATCWREEERGLASYRLVQSPKFPLPAEEMARHGDTKGVPRHVEIIFDTVCDLKCVYCGPDFSSAWGRDVAHYGPLPGTAHPPSSSAPPGFADTFWRWFALNRDGLDYVQINGGEPLFNPRFRRFAEELLAAEPPSRFTFGLITNLNTPPARLRELLPLLRALSERHRLRFGVSQDSIGPRAEYIRSGLSWDRFADNLNTVLTECPAADVQIAPTMSALNVTSIEKLLVWLDELGADVELRPSIVDAPAFQSPLILPADLRPYLERAIRLLERKGRWPAMRVQLEGLVSILGGDDDRGDELRRAFHAYFAALDRRRGSSLPAVFPELEPFWKHCAALSDARPE